MDQKVQMRVLPQDVISSLRHPGTVFNTQQDDSEDQANSLKTMETFLIISGEGHWKTEFSFLMECSTIEEAEEKFAEFKAGDYRDTYLFIFKATKVKEA